MKSIKKILMAAAFVASSTLPSVAITNAEVLDAMNLRIAEISQQMAAVQLEISAATNPADQAVLLRELQVLNVRRGQLRSLSRIVPRYNERFLVRIVTHFDLDVSVA